MKNLKWIGPLLIIVSALGLYGCSKEQAPASPVEDAATAAEQAVDEAVDAAAEQAEQAADDTLEVVEESASEAEPADEAIKLALAESPAAAREWQFKEGQHYVRMVPTQPTVGGADKIEVAEFFWYGCPHCYDMEPFINKWAEGKDPGVRFVKVPATWNSLVRLHAQLYYTEEVLVRNERHQGPCRLSGGRLPGIPSSRQSHDVGRCNPENFRALWRIRGTVPEHLEFVRGQSETTRRR